MNLRKFLSTLMLVAVVSLSLTSVVFAAEKSDANATLLVSEEQPLDVASGEITEDKEVAKAEVVATEEAVESGEVGISEEAKEAGTEKVEEAKEDVKSEEATEPASEEVVEAKEDKTEEAKEAKTEEAVEAKEEKTKATVEDKSGDAKAESGDAQVSGDAKAESGDAQVSGDAKAQSGDTLVSGDKAEESGDKVEEDKKKLPNDVTEEKWFANYVAKAVEDDYMKVDEDGNFLPYNKATKKEAVESLTKFASESGDAMENQPATEEEISREDVAVLVYEVAKSRGKGFDVDKLELIDFEDVLEISVKNYEAVAWCNVNGILQGRPGKIFAAKDITTRAELATVLVRLEAVLQ